MDVPAAAEAFVAFLRGEGCDACGVSGGGTAAFVARWQAAGFLMTTTWQQQLAAAWGEALRAQARRDGGGGTAAAAREAADVLDPAVSPLLSMLDVGVVALHYHHGREVAAWAEDELAQQRRASGAGRGDRRRR